MQRTPFYLALLLLLVLPVGMLFADVYVSSAGNDANDGLTAGTAKATLSAAVAVLNTQGPGSVLRVLSSLTENTTVFVTASGASGNPIVIRSDPPGSPFTLAGQVIAVSGTFVSIQSLIFDGQGARESSIVIDGAASDCTISDCQFTGVASSADLFAPEDLSAFVTVLGAQNVTIANCAFNPSGFTNLCVLLSSSPGPAANFTMTGCIVNSNDLTGGVKAYRAWNNIQILNTQFLDMRIFAFELESSGSAVNSGTSDNILIQDCVIRGHTGTDSNLGAIRIFNSWASNVRVIRCHISDLGLGGVDGVAFLGSGTANPNPVSVDGVLVDELTFVRHPDSTSAFQCPIVFRSPTTTVGAQRPFVQNITIQNCSSTARVQVQFEYVFVQNVTIRDSSFHNPYAGDATALRFQDGTHARNVLVERVYILNNGGDDGMAFFGTRFTGAERISAIGVTVRDCVFIARPASLTTSTAEGIAFKDGTHANVAIYDTLLNANVAFNVSRSGCSLDGLIIDNCVLNAGDPSVTSYLLGGFVLREDAGAPGATLRNATITNSTITGVSGIVMANASTPNVVENISFTNCNITGYQQGTTVGGITTLSNLSFTDCTITGNVLGGFVARNLDSAMNATGVSFTDCDFVSTNTNDVATKRNAACLFEGALTNVNGLTFDNCTFNGGNFALSLARNNVTLGPGDEPTISNLLVQDCTMENAIDRGLNVTYVQGGDLTFRRVTVRDATEAQIFFYGDDVLVEDFTLNAGGGSGGLILATKDGSPVENWMVRDSALTNLGGGGVNIFGPVRDSTLDNVTVAGGGILVDNSGAASTGDAPATIAVMNSQVSGAPGRGIEMHGSGHRVQGCTVSNAGGSGIAIREVNLLLPANQNVAVVTNTVHDCGGAALVLEGRNSTLGWNTTYRNGAGVLLRTGASGVLAATSNTTGNLVTRNCLFGGVPASATGISVETSPQVFGDTGPRGNVYLNNTATDWALGSEFIGAGNTIQNNIFAFNTGAGLRILPAALSGLAAGWNCAAMNGGLDFDGIAIDYDKDIWFNPEFVSRDPASPDFYLLAPASPCRDRGTPVGTGVDLGCRESGPSEVQSWRLY